MNAVNVGINNIRNGRVDVTLPMPLLVDSIESSSGTSASFSNGATGSSVSWNLNTLDSNSQSRLHIHTTGTLPTGSGAQMLTVRASMTADGIRSGDAVATRTIQLMP